MNQHAYGAAGERMAEAYLTAHGARVLARNYRCPMGELDIIVAMDDHVVFVEVKRRGSGRFGRGAYAVDRFKQQHIIRSAQWYLKQQRMRDVGVRFDVIEVSDDGVRHIKAAFYADAR